jgi:hypothetical protein
LGEPHTAYRRGSSDKRYLNGAVSEMLLCFEFGFEAISSISGIYGLPNSINGRDGRYRRSIKGKVKRKISPIAGISLAFRPR